jgi:hypothetical protein
VAILFYTEVCVAILRPKSHWDDCQLEKYFKKIFISQFQFFTGWRVLQPGDKIK